MCLLELLIIFALMRENLNLLELKVRAEEMRTVFLTETTERTIALKIERIHSYMTKVYDMLWQDLPTISKKQRFAMTLRALNNTPD